MAKVLCVGCPYHPPIIHGHAFEPDADGVHYFAEVLEVNFEKFLIGVEGSPFFLETPENNPNPNTPPPGGNSESGSEEEGGEGGEGGANEDEGGSEEGAEGGSPGNPPTEIDLKMAEFMALTSKAAVVELAKERLGLILVLDNKTKLEGLRAEVRAEFERLATL